MSTTNIYSGRGTCDVASPDGAYGCTKKLGHESPDCRNLSVQLSWCGDCALWTCHHLEPNPDTVEAQP